MAKEFFEYRKLSGTISIKLDEGRRWNADKESIVDNIVGIVTRYQKQGLRLTLRQLYYQLVAAEIIPNHDTVYKKIGSIKDDMCYAGKLDWSAIEDRNRVPHIPFFVEDIPDAIRIITEQYGLDLQKGQKNNVELWTEKDAISGILKRATDPYCMRLVVNKGYTSSSAIYTAYQRFSQAIISGQSVIILYFGDHDPSGLDMIRDIYDRVMFMFLKGQKIGREFSNILDEWEETDEYKEIIDEWYEEDGTYDKEEDRYFFDREKAFFRRRFIVKQIGLTMQQIKQFNPPPNPAKITDPRAKEYIKKFGQVSWEVDALKPEVMQEIIKVEIAKVLDLKEYKKMKGKEEEDIEKMKIIEENYENLFEN